MQNRKTLTLLIMDAPYESANSTTALRLVDAALSKGHNVNVFAYEGAVNLSMSGQKPHQNPVKGQSVEEADHPTTIKAIEALLKKGSGGEEGPQLEWVNCGLCVDERGVQAISGVKRGSPADFFKSTQACDATLVIPTK